MLLLYPLVLERGGHRWQIDLAACAGALALAYLMHRFVERPTQASRWGRPAWLAAGAGMSAATAGLAALMLLALPPGVGPGPAMKIASPADVGQVQRAVAASTGTKVAPSNLTVDQGPCVYGDPDGARTVVLFGDNHREQWQPAVDAAGRDGGWKVASWTKSSCPLPNRAVHRSGIGHRVYVECERWRTATLDRVLALEPDLVLLNQSDEVAQTDATARQYADGTVATVATVDRLRRAGLDVTYVLDNPHPEGDVPACLSQHLDDVAACTVDEDASEVPERRAARPW